MRFPLATGYFGFIALALCGCASDAKYSAPVRITGDPITDATQMIEHGPKKDRVLWQYQAALAELRQGRFDDAKRTLDDALALVGGVKTADKNSRKARSYFHAESNKTFVGEPYERVMAYYYRGILYWMDGEPDNARACFRSAQIQDSDTEDKTYSADYVLLDYLDGLATAKLAGDGSDADKRARSLDKTHLLPPCDPKANVLLFVDFGQGPIKRANGSHNEELHFREGFSRARKARLTLDGQVATLPPFDDLYFQATTRGGRVMDHILGNKAVFKDVTAVVGVGEMVGGAVLLADRDTRGIGAGLLALGALTEVVSAVTVPEADTRMWESLPQYLSFAAITASPGQHQATVDFLDTYDHPILGLSKTITLNVPSGTRDTVIYISDQSKSF
jgi:tetratricopeptide (TPR) repeat protein